MFQLPNAILLFKAGSRRVGSGSPRIAPTGHCISCDRPLRTRPPASAEVPPSSKDAAKLLAARLGLTSRQAEVLHWIAEGKTNSEIGLILDCSIFTIKNHTKEIFRRLGVHTRVAAAACAYRATTTAGS